MQDSSTDAETIVDPRDAAESAGLVYVSDERRGIQREKAGDGFGYLKPNGEPVRDAATLERIRKLAVPPAWTDVWICPKVNGHIQATGRDARGRKQYKYHPQFREVREGTKYEHMMEFARALPEIRAKLAEHMALREFESLDTQAGAKKNVRAAIERVASRLGNTPTICRKCHASRGAGSVRRRRPAP